MAGPVFKFGLQKYLLLLTWFTKSAMVGGDGNGLQDTNLVRRSEPDGRRGIVIGNGQLRICRLFFDIATKWQLGDRSWHVLRGAGWNGSI